MAMFGKEERQSETRSPANDAVLTIISAGMNLVGDLEGPGLVKVDGNVEGSVTGSRQIIVGRDGVVKGNLAAAEATIAGTIHGTVTTSDRVEVQSSATVNGDIQTRVIVVHEGARINGTVRMSQTAGEAVERRPAVQVMR